MKESSLGDAPIDAGLNLSDLQASLGHKRKETSLVYTKRDVTFDHEAARRVARQMGLIDEGNSYPDQAAIAYFDEIIRTL